MVSISLCMIVRDEEETIARCLDSVKDIMDEIVVVDTGSQDRTKEIVGNYTSNIYEFEWINDFSAARNYSFSKATQDYILWMDADDVLLEEDRQKLRILKQQMDSSIDVVLMKYNLGVDGKGRPLCTYYRERLLKRSNHYEWQEPVHEYINPIGKIITVDIAITHRKMKPRTTRNLEIFEKMIQNGKDLSHRSSFYYARELYANDRFDEAKEYFEKFLSEKGGLLANYIDACLELSKIYTRMGDRKTAIKTLLRCFEYGPPRAEICFEIGNQYKEQSQYERAISWYEIATKVKKPENSLGSVIHDCYDFFPYVEISVCYFKLKRIKEAILWNEKAAKCKPDSEIVKNNQKYFEAYLRMELLWNTKA